MGNELFGFVCDVFQKGYKFSYVIEILLMH